jgi:hypothetical protein
MMNADVKQTRRRGSPALSEVEQVFDHFVSGFEWTIPTKLKVVDPMNSGFVLLTWSIVEPGGPVHAGPGLLEDFLKLEHGSDEAILAYARRWGPLWLCGHGLSFRHAPDCRPMICDWDVSDGDDDYGTWFDEPVGSWRAVSRWARATVRLARRLHNGQLGRDEDWEAIGFFRRVLRNVALPRPGLFTLADDEEPDLDAVARRLGLPEDWEFGPDPDGEEDDPAGADVVQFDDDDDLDESDETPDPVRARFNRVVLAYGRMRMESLEFQRQLLSALINFWLKQAGVEPQMNWMVDKPSVQLGGQGLMGALAVQLLFDCSRTDGLAVCTSCGTPFLPANRRPRRDRNPYCSDCGMKAVARDAAARYRQSDKYRQTYRTWLEKRRGAPTA